MVVDSVLVGGQPAVFSHAGDTLDVVLDRPYLTGEKVRLTVSYGGKPNPAYVQFQTIDGKPHIYTFSEPWGARAWWPCQDYPDAKPDSVDLRVWAPTGVRIASNGVLKAESDDGTAAFAWWQENYPITPYLVSITAYPYRVYQDWFRSSPADSMELRFYDFPFDTALYVPVQAKIKDMLATFTREYGPYPYPHAKYGQAEFTWPGGEEHQTMSSMGTSDESTAAHELTHQWWGDMITCKNFHEIWMNEGFAVYGEALWAEASGGTAAYRNKMAVTQYLGSGTVYRPEDDNWNEIFDLNLAYHKGSWVLHMLRHVVGDSTFFQIYHEYYRQYQYRSADTDDFRQVAEQVWSQNSGSPKSLKAFFHQWIYVDGSPIYYYEWTKAPAAGGWDVTLALHRMQDSLYVMPVDVRVNGGQGSETFVVQDSTKDQSFSLHVAGEPDTVDLDPDQWILCRILGPVGTPTLSKPILLVNSASWRFSTGAELAQSYQNRAFLGDVGFDFWDCDGGPDVTYPWTLPAPLGTGPIPGDVLGRYRTVLWVSGGDPGYWIESPVYSYLKAGGNVLLLAGSGLGYLSLPYQRYLGIQFSGPDTIHACTASVPGLADLRLNGPQPTAPVFTVSNGAPSTILYGTDVPGSALGVIARPVGGGPDNPDGGQFLFLSGLPYRWNSDDLRRDIGIILSQYMPPKLDPSLRLQISAAAPNPFREATGLRFYLPFAAQTRLLVYDAAGRRVRTLRNELSPAGWNAEPWDGKDEAGNVVPSGVYFSRLESGGQTALGRLVRVR